MNTAKVYTDSDGNECTIHQMVRQEPEWAAARIQVGERAIERVKQLEVLIENNNLSNTRKDDHDE